MSILNLISSDGFICVNKNIIRKIGLNCAVLLGELASQYNYWVSVKQISNDGYFYLTGETCTYNTGLSYYEQTKAIDKLVELNILQTKTAGMPAKKYYKIDETALIEFLNTSSEDFTNQVLKNSKTCIENFETNNNINNNIILDDKSSKEVNDFLSNSTKKEVYKASEENKKEKVKDPDNTRAYKNLVEFIESLRYNQSTKDNLMLWYKNVGVGKVSIKQLKDKIIKLHDAKFTEEQISDAFYKSYMNGWFAFYVTPAYSSKEAKTDVMYQTSERVSEDTLIKNEDGSLKVY